MPSGVVSVGHGTSAGSAFIVIYDAAGNPSGSAIQLAAGWHAQRTLGEIIERGGLSPGDVSRIEGASRQRVERVHEVAVPFGSSLPASRVVHLALAGLDIPGGASARIDVTEVAAALDSKNAISRDQGFILHVRTWADSRLWSAKVSWLTI